MMKQTSILCGVSLLLAGAAGAQTVVGSRHDLSSTGPGATTNVTQVCVFCHTPHQAAAANGQDPLWNHTISSTAAYGVYGSSTLNAAPTDIGGAAAGSAAVSNLCMSCHDGTVAVHSLYNAPNEAPINNNPANVTVTAGGHISAAGLVTGTPNLGTNLTDDHPIKFTYNTALATADGGLRDPATTPAVAAMLFAGSVECASCHNPHNATNAPFLRVNNTGSALCTTCHVK